MLSPCSQNRRFWATSIIPQFRTMLVICLCTAASPQCLADAVCLCISTMSRWRRVPCQHCSSWLRRPRNFEVRFYVLFFVPLYFALLGHIFSFSLRIHTVADLQIKFHLHINTAVPSVTIVGFSQGKRQDQRAGELNDSLHFAMDKRTNCRGSWRSNHKRKTAYTSRLVSRKYLKLRSWWRE